MKGLEKKSNKELLELKLKLSEDFEVLREELKFKITHWENVKEAYNKVHSELKKRNAL